MSSHGERITIVFTLRGPSRIMIPPFHGSLLEIIDFSDPFVILILKSNLTINARIWTWRRRRNIFDFGASKGGHERGVRRCAFVVFLMSPDTRDIQRENRGSGT